MTLALNRKENPSATQYRSLVERVARRLARNLPSHVDLQDLISAGMLGLIDAMDRYDPSKQSQFEKYAEWRIKGAMLDELRESDPLTRDQRRQVNELKEATHVLWAKLGREPDEGELAALLKTDVSTVRARRECWQAATVVRPESFDMLDAGPFDPESTLLEAEDRRRLARAMSSLPERMRAVLELSYVHEMTLKEIGGRLGVTESRVCQLRSETIRELRKKLAA